MSKLPGKRDRKRKGRGGSEPGMPATTPPQAEASEAGAAPRAEPAAPAFPAPSPSPVSPTPLAPAAAPLQRRGPAAALAGLALVPLLVILALSSREPAPGSAEPPAPLEPVPMAVLEDPPLPPRPAATLPPLEPPLPAERDALEGDGWSDLAAALATHPRPSPQARVALERAVRDPAQLLEEPVLAQVRAAWPGVEALARAARHQALAAREGLHDLQALRDVALCALAVGQLEARGGGRALGAARALDVLRLGRALGAAEDPVPAAVGAALVRLARTWLEHRLPAAETAAPAERAWTRAELAWLARALARAQETAPSAAAPIHDGAVAPVTSPAEPADPRAAAARQQAAEGRALAELAARVEALLNGREGTR